MTEFTVNWAFCIVFRSEHCNGPSKDPKFCCKIDAKKKKDFGMFFLKKKLCGVHPAKLINLLCVRRNTAIVS